MVQMARSMESGEKALEDTLADLVDLFEAGEVDGGQAAFETARHILERRGRLTFASWMARVMSELAVDELAPEAYRSFYDKGMSPAEAVLTERMEAGVLEADKGHGT